MEKVPVRELNQHTSAVLARVETGETLEITKDGRPVARLVPIERGQSLLDRLVAEGRATPATDHSPFTMPQDLGDSHVSVADALVAMREEERW